MNLRDLILLFCLFSSTPTLAVDSSIQWKVLESPHFEVIYDERYREQAEIFLKASETAYKSLSGVFSEHEEKTLVLILDNSDLANGFATFLPYPSIVVFPVMPDSMDDLSSFDHWALELMIHEYTHILSMKPSHGFYTPLRWIFGSVIRPNAVLPRWFLEGIAVEMESRFTRHGRLRSPATSASLRALVEDGELQDENLARINEGQIPEYPFGSRPYLFGSLLWNQILEEKKDDSVINSLHQRYSRRLPFLINTPLEDEIGSDYSEVLKRLYNRVHSKAQEQLERIRNAGNYSPEKNQFGFPEQSLQDSPRISPDQRKMLFYASQYQEGDHLWLLEKSDRDKSFKNLKPQKLAYAKGFTRASWSPDSRSFVFDRLDVWKRHYRFRDLYLYDLHTRKEERLTFGERASNADFAPDGKHIVYVRKDGGRNELKVLNLKTRAARVLFRPPLFIRVSDPVFLSPSEIVFSIRDLSGEQSLYRLQLDSQDGPQKTLKAFPEARPIERSPQGLLFLSSKTGTENLYLANANLDSARALTNTTSRVSSASLDKESLELWTAELTGHGSRLFRISRPRYQNPPYLGSLVLPSHTWPKTSVLWEQPEIREKDYSSLRYLLPRYWIPFLYPVDGGILFQGSTGSQDPVGINSYLLDLSFDTVTERWSYGFSFLNQSWPVGLQLDVSEYQDYLGSSDLVLTQRRQSLGLLSYLPGLDEKYRLQVSGSNAETQTPSRRFNRHGARLGLSYSDLEELSSSRLYSGGNLISFLYTHYFEGKDLTSYEQYQLSLAHRWKRGLPYRHSLLVQAKGSHAPLLDLQTEVVALGEKTLGGNYLASLLNSSYLMRGYPSGAFVGRSLWNLNLEYSLPFWDIYQGPGSFPLFFNHLELAVFTDAVAVDGGFYDIDRNLYRSSKIEDSFWSSGLEFRLKTTAAYHMPLDFTFGLYYGYDRKAGGGFTTFLGLGYTPHESVQ